MKSVRLTLIINVFVLLAFSISTSGCAVPNIRVSETLFEKNPIQKIAVIAEGEVDSVNYLTHEYGIELLWSKETLETMTPDICEGLKKKNYDVVFCEVAGVGYHGGSSPGQWVYEDDEQGKSTRKIVQSSVIYEYPIVKERAVLQVAAKNVFQALEESILKQQVELFMPAQTDISALGKATGADTVCLNRVYGLKRSSGVQFREMAVAVITGVTVNMAGGVYHPEQAKTDTVEPFMMCVAASNGEVIWQYGAPLYAYYSNSAGDHDFSYHENELSALFKDFPGRDKLMDAKFKSQKTDTAV